VGYFCFTKNITIYVCDQVVWGSTQHAVGLYWIPGHAGVTISPTSLQGMALLYILSDLSQPWESIGKIYEEGLDVG